MHLEVYKEPLCRRYYATPCSFACIYCLGTLATLLLVPFFMAYDPYTFWVKTNTYLEQPEVTHTKQLLLLAEGFKAGETFSASFVTMVGLSDFHHADLRDAVVKSFPADTNGDGLMDRLMVNARLPLAEDEEIHSLKMMVFLRARLRDRAKVEMDALAYVEHAGPLAGGSVEVDGDLRMRQTWPLSLYGGQGLKSGRGVTKQTGDHIATLDVWWFATEGELMWGFMHDCLMICGQSRRNECVFPRLAKTAGLLRYKAGYRYPYLEDPLLDAGTVTSASQVLFSSLLKRYAARNLTLDFETRYAVWERAPAYATSGGRGPGVGGHRSFNVTTVFRINQQPILYTPPVSEVLQSGWSKYVVMLVVVLFIVDGLSAFIFKHQVVETKVAAPRVGGYANGLSR